MPSTTNFAFLSEHDPQLVRYGMLAERYFPEDPNTCLIKLRQLTELLSQRVASRTGLCVSAEEGQFVLLRRLQCRGLLAARYCRSLPRGARTRQQGGARHGPPR